MVADSLFWSWPQRLSDGQARGIRLGQRVYALARPGNSNAAME